MKNTIFAIFLVFMLALTACSSKVISTQTEQESEKAAVEGRVQSSGTDYAAMLESVKSETIAKNDKTMEMQIPFNFKKGKIGDTVVFGVNLNSINRREGTMFARVKYIEARDMNSNPIEVDRDLIKTWIRTSETEDFVLEADKSYYLPISFVIGQEIKSGVKTVSGTYTFEVEIFGKEGNIETDLNGFIKSVYLRVE